MNTATKITLAVAILMNFGSFPAEALEPGECGPWNPVRGGLCKIRKCVVGEKSALRVEYEEVCPQAIPKFPVPVPPVNRDQTIKGVSPNGDVAPR